MGYRNQSRDYFQAASCSLTTTKAKDKTSKKEKTKTTESMNADIHLEHRASSSQASTKENPRLAYATGSTGLAITVRGSSRRIMIMRFRPANIRLINRRSNLLRLLLALSSGKENANHQNKPIDLAQLTRSLHIRPRRPLTRFSVVGRLLGHYPLP
jgi:hypothetical protein